MVADQNGFLYTYVVTDHFVANKDDVQLLDQGNYQKKLLTLQTSYPIGTALKRYIVRAELKE
jgi:sortase (surface protein transpeptidase)